MFVGMLAMLTIYLDLLIAEQVGLSQIAPRARCFLNSRAATGARLRGRLAQRCQRRGRRTGMSASLG